jgi:hypothetical protein
MVLIYTFIIRKHNGMSVLREGALADLGVPYTVEATVSHTG